MGPTVWESTWRSRLGSMKQRGQRRSRAGGCGLTQEAGQRNVLLCMSSLPKCPLCPYHKPVSPCHMSSVPYPSPPQAKPFADDYFATAYEECSLDRYPPEGVCPDAVLGRNEEDEPGMSRNDNELNNVKLIYGHRVDGEWYSLRSTKG